MGETKQDFMPGWHEALSIPDSVKRRIADVFARSLQEKLAGLAAMPERLQVYELQKECTKVLDIYLGELQRMARHFQKLAEDSIAVSVRPVCLSVLKPKP